MNEFKNNPDCKTSETEVLRHLEELCKSTNPEEKTYLELENSTCSYNHFLFTCGESAVVVRPLLDNPAPGLHMRCPTMSVSCETIGEVDSTPFTSEHCLFTYS